MILAIERRVKRAHVLHGIGEWPRDGEEVL